MGYICGFSLKEDFTEVIIMARISGVDLPREKRVEIGLTYIYGIGLPSSQRILKEANVNPDTRCADRLTMRLEDSARLSRQLR